MSDSNVISSVLPSEEPTTCYHVAQVNIGRMKAPLDSPAMAGLVARLDAIHVLADGSLGFVWRPKTSAGNATCLRPYEHDRILFNLSWWVPAGHISGLDEARNGWLSRLSQLRQVVEVR